MARYNANGDSGRFDDVVRLFAPDAVMDVGGRSFAGQEQIRSMFASSAADLREIDSRPALRHFTSTLQIDVRSPRWVSSRCYYLVLLGEGLDHWGRYIDDYRTVGGEWRFAHRRVTLDGVVPGGWGASRA